MPLYSGMFLKVAGAALTVGAAGAGTWYLVIKDRVEWTALDKEAFGGKNGTWQWSLTASNDSSSATVTATLTGTLNAGSQKTWTCILKGTASGDGATSPISTDGIKEQINGDFRTKTGLPEINVTGGASPANWTVTKENETFAGNFFGNCIRNRSETEKTGAKEATATSATSTINLGLVEEQEKYKFEVEEFKKVYLGVYYNPKTPA